SHIQMHVDDAVRAGTTPEEARRDAVRRLGGVDVTKEAVRDRRRLPLFETAWKDLRFAGRSLARNPSFAVVTIATLALGIGATVAIFSAVYAVLLAPLPYPNPDGLVVPVSTNAARGFDRAGVPYADYLDWRQQRDIFADVAVWQPTAVDVAAGGTAMPERVEAAGVSQAFFDVLGVRPMIGRTFEAAAHDATGARVAGISDRVWRRTLGGVPDVLDRDLRIGGVPVRIVGVLPPH